MTTESAAEAALALARDSLLEETRSRARVLEALNIVAMGTAGMVDVTKVAELTVDQARTLVGADAVILRWFDEESQLLHLLSATGTEAWDLRADVTAGEMGAGFLNGEARIYEQFEGHPLADIANVRAGVRAVAVIPLSIRDRPAGALEVARGADGFSAADLEVLSLLGAQAAPALEASRLQLALRASELRFKTAFEHSPTGLAISGPESQYLAVSPALCDMLGYGQAELLGRDYFELTHPDDRELARERARQLRDGEVDGYRITKRYLHRDGRTVWAEVSVAAVRDEQGAVVQLISQAQDITARKLAEDSLRASEARNAAVIEAAVDSLIISDAEGRVTGFNPSAEHLFGYRRAEVLGRDLLALIVPERFHAAHRAALRGNLDRDDRRYLDRRIEIVLRRADGTELPAEVSVSRFEVDGSPNFSTSIRDLTDRDQLLASRDRLAQVVSNTPVMLFAFDKDGLVTLAEGHALALLGIPPGSAVGANVFDLVADIPEALEHLRRGLAGESFAGPIHLPALGIWLEARYDPIRDPAGNLAGMAGLATDISDRVRGAAAREESDAKSRLVAVVNHEVRTPLNSILGFTELLLNERIGPLNDKQRRYATNVEAAGRHLLALVNDSLDLSRIAAGKMDLDILGLELAPILEQAAGQVQPLVDARGLKIRVRARRNTWVRADRRRLLQMLWNLLSNAIRHTPSGGMITISSRVGRQRAEISVTDTGIGVPADQLERIFEEYAQIEGQADGTGLGLPVSRRLARLMDGDIRVVSETGAGSTFTITLPRGHTSTA